MNSISYSEDQYGYKILSDETGFIREHQLAALNDNNPHLVFAPNTVVHHQTGFKGDSRSEALSVITRSEHGALHKNGSWSKVNGEDRLMMNDQAKQITFSDD